LVDRSVAMNGIAVERVLHGKNHARRGTAARDFFNNDGVSDVVEACAAFGFGEWHAGKSQFRRFLEQLARETARLVEFLRQRTDFRFREFAHALVQQLLFFCKFEVHRGSLPVQPTLV